MIIKIAQCTNDGWHRNYIGCTFEAKECVYPISNHFYEVGDGFYVAKIDAEIVKEQTNDNINNSI